MVLPSSAMHALDRRAEYRERDNQWSDDTCRLLKLRRQGDLPCLQHDGIGGREQTPAASMGAGQRQGPAQQP